MIISLSLQDFRSFKRQKFSFSTNTTVIVGPNASGKTNILEAIYLLAAGKSFRAEVDREMIKDRCQMSNVKCQMSVIQEETGSLILETGTKQEERLTLEVILTRGEVQGMKVPYKKYMIDGTPKRMTDFVGNLRAVLFWPQDLELITDSPAKRRRYLDNSISQVDWQYRRSIISFDKGLRSRNRVLERIRNNQGTEKELFFWNRLLIKNGNMLTNKREEFIDFINQKKFTIDGQLLSLSYDKNIISYERLESFKEEEIKRATTLVGPHRDDFVVNVKWDKGEDGRNLHSHGSRGEQRLAVLYLKLAEIDFIQMKTENRPILLLDDILSELDHNHRQVVIDTIPKQQTIITTTDEHLLEGLIPHAKIITL